MDPQSNRQRRHAGATLPSRVGCPLALAPAADSTGRGHFAIADGRGLLISTALGKVYNFGAVPNDGDVSGTYSTDPSSPPPASDQGPSGTD